MTKNTHERIEINPINENLGNLPKVLYKYRYFDACDYSIKLASNGEAYFASAKEFNDPFDNYFIPTSKLSEYEGDELIAYLEMKAHQHFPNATSSEIDEFIVAGQEQHHKLIIGDPSAFDSVIETQYKKFGIFSLSADPRSIPMWAYYGDSHKGFCVGLSTSKIAEHQSHLVQNHELLMLHQVDYRERILKYCVDVSSDGFTTEDLEKLEATLYTKSKCWAHELEYRLIFYNYVSKNYIFGTDAVAEVLVGLRVSEENMEKLLNQLTISNSKAKVKRAVRSHSTYSLDFKEISY